MNTYRYVPVVAACLAGVFFLTMPVRAEPGASSRPAASAGQWQDLLAGGSLAQWTDGKGGAVSDGWRVEDGIVHRVGQAGSIFTRAVYEDFELEFEWKISEGGNSGVKYRVKQGLGLEYQVLDDALHRDGKMPTHRAASLYDLVAAPDDKPVHAPGSWNQARVVVQGGRIEHWLNGTRVVSIDQSTPDWQQRFERSKYRENDGFGIGPGQILLQDHGDEVWFRNLRIRPLTAKPSSR